MATRRKFRHEDIRAVPKGYKVRTITHPSGHLVRVAFPPGRRKKGSGEVVSLLHPITGKNPCPNPCKFNPGVVESAKAKLQAIKERIKALFCGEKSKRNWNELVKDSAGKQWFVDVASSGKRYMAEGYPVAGKKAPRVGKPKVAYGPSESEAYDALLTKIEPNPKPQMDYKMAHAAATDAGNRHMRAAGRKGWDESDYDAALAELNRLWPEDRPNPKGKNKRNVAPKGWYGFIEFKDGSEKYTKKQPTQKKATLAAALSLDLHPDWKPDVKTYGAVRNPKRKNKSKRKAQKAKGKAKRNLDEIRQAAALAGAFKGSPAENVRQIDLSNKQRDDYAHLGWMEQEVFHPPYDRTLLDLPKISDDYRRLYDKSGDSLKSWREVAAKHGAVLLVFDLEGDEIELTSSADGQQLYFLGGNQASFGQLLGQFKSDTARDKVDLGELVSVTYTAQKKQAGDTEPRGYYHVFGEERGTAPRAYFDMLNKRVFLTGGSYHIKDPKLGIIN